MKNGEANTLGQTFSEAVESSEEQNSQVSILDKLNANNLPELQGWKEKQEKLVEENPYIEILDSKTYDLACKSRTALLKGRTSLESQDKLIASKVSAFRKSVGDETKTLISITLPHEEKQQIEVKRYEGIKESECLDRERLENERIEKIKNKISENENSFYDAISKSDEKLLDNTSVIDMLFSLEFDFEEYDILFQQSKNRMQTVYDNKIIELKEKRTQRIENERLATENAEAKRLTELQANRLTEIMPYVSFGDVIDLTKLSELSEESYMSILKAKIDLFNSDSLAKENAEIERITKEKQEKEKVFDIRINRLKEIGLDLSIDSLEERSFFTNEFHKEFLTSDEVFNANTLEFEELLLNAKNEIESDKIEVEEIKVVDIENVEENNIVVMQIVDTTSLTGTPNKSLNLINDKTLLTNFIESLDFHNAVPEMQNEETQKYLDSVIEEVNAMKKQLILTLNNI